MTTKTDGRAGGDKRKAAIRKKKRRQRITTNEHGNVDIRFGLPRGLMHISRSEYGDLRIKSVCDATGVPCAPALVDFEEWRRGHWKPVLDGVVIRARYYADVADEIDQRQARREQRDARAEAKRLRRQDELKAYEVELPSKYEDPWAALADAAKAMFNLNRYCKHSGCPPAMAQEVYGLKNRFIRILYQSGYAFESYRHLQHLDGKECWACDGSGEGWSLDGCHRCGGSGMYMEATTHTFVVFRFRINGQVYTWHQPEHLIEYRVHLTAPDSQMVEVEPKALEIPEDKLAEALVLVRWVLAKMEGHQDAGETEAEGGQLDRRCIPQPMEIGQEEIRPPELARAEIETA